MAKTKASIVLAVLVLALFLKGYNATESVEKGYPHHKDDSHDFKDKYFNYFICLKLNKLCYYVDHKYCYEYFDKCKDHHKTAAKGAKPNAESQIP